MSFFVRGKPPKHKNKTTNGTNNKRRRTNEFKEKRGANEEISSSDEEQNIIEGEEEYKEPEYNDETPQEKKLRLAKAYLKEIERSEKNKAVNQELDDVCKGKVIQQRLKEDYLKQIGRFKITVADSYKSSASHSVLKCKEHKSAITTVCLSSDDKFIYSGSKDGKVVLWSLEEKKKLSSTVSTKWKDDSHPSKVLSLAISSDNKFLAVGDSNCNIQVLNPRTLEHIKTLAGHKNSVTSLTFRKGTHTLYSASLDRSVKVWSLDDMMYVETLYGHLDGITMIDALTRERAITAGGKDSSLRMWNIAEDSQLIYNGDFGSMDVVKFISEESFASGGDNGQLNIWGVNKKKPLCSVKTAHGVDKTNDQPNWICSLTSLTNSDLIATGSYDNHIRLWKLSEGLKNASLQLEIPLNGFINTLNFTSDGNALIAGVGGEHRLGRWNVIKGVKNCLVLIPLIRT